MTVESSKSIGAARALTVSSFCIESSLDFVTLEDDRDEELRVLEADDGGAGIA